MAICPKCNAQIDDSSRFCSSCGHQMNAPVTDVNSGAQAKSKGSFAATLTAFFSTVVEKIKKIPKMWLLIGAAGIAAIIALSVIITIISAIFGGNDDYTLYLKDDEIFFSDLSKDDPWQVTTEFNTNGNFSGSQVSSIATALSYYCKLANDGKTLFYIDKVEGSGSYVSLYYRNVQKPSQESNKISSEVISYSVNKKTTLVTYLKGIEGNLYQYSMKSEDSEKIATDVKYYHVSEDGKTIIYQTKDNGVYYYISGKDRVKIDSEVENLEYTDSLDAVYYIKEGSLYRAKLGKDKEKLVSDVNSIVKVVDCDTVYFTKREKLESMLKNYIIDDKKDFDATLVAPTRPKTPFRSDFETLEEYNAAYEKYQSDYEAYLSAYDEYMRKLDRDELREYIETIPYTRYKNNLYYYDGKVELTVCNNYEYMSANVSGKSMLIYKATDESKLEKVKLSEVDSKYNLTYSVDTAFSNASQWYIAFESESTYIAPNTANSLRTNEDGSVIFYFDGNGTDTQVCDIYKLTVKRQKVSEPELYDTEVYTSFIRYTDDNIMYFKDYNSEANKGELYMNKKKVDFDVYSYNIKYNEKSGTLAYFVDWNEEKANGTLKVYNGKKSKKVNDEVHSVEFSAEGNVLYLYDYSINYYKGDLYVYNKGKSKKMDMEVSALVPVLSAN